MKMFSVISNKTSIAKSFLHFLKSILSQNLRQQKNLLLNCKNNKLRRIQSDQHHFKFGKALHPSERKRALFCNWYPFWNTGSSKKPIPQRSIFDRNESLESTNLRLRNELLKQHSRSNANALEFLAYNQNIPQFSLKNLMNSRNGTSLPSGLISSNDLKDILEQKYLPQSVRDLGPDLAAVHFFTDRRAAVRLVGYNDWIVGGVPKITNDELIRRCVSGDSSDEEHYVNGCYVEAVDCSNFQKNGLRFEGLKYLSELKFLKFLSLKNQKFINVWCLDRIAGQNGPTLEYLDISKCKLDLGCICALSRMPSLEMLIVKHPGRNIELNKGLVALQHKNPNLTVRTIYLEDA